MTAKFLTPPVSHAQSLTQPYADGLGLPLFDRIVWDLPTLDPPAILLIAVPVYLLLANAAAYICFGVDKRRAIAGEWRISEATLLTLAALGGWLGAKAGQRRFRHKTRKEPFRSILNMIPAVQACGVAALWAATR
jgi:uncharacterized membrane protein YsdA (DUF1294 family)